MENKIKIRKKNRKIPSPLSVILTTIRSHWEALNKDQKEAIAESTQEIFKAMKGTETKKSAKSRIPKCHSILNSSILS